MFKTLKPSFNKKSANLFEEIYKESISSLYTLFTDKYPTVRPSSFPMCSVKLYKLLLEYVSTGKIADKQTFDSEFFTSVGTVAHTIFQKYMGFTGYVYGNWVCRVCKKSLYGFENICPTCKNPMEYNEIELNYKGIKGHVDCLLKYKNKWWILDYKTSTKNIIDRLDKPKYQHKLQVMSYAYLLWRSKGIKVSGCSVLYISRDNPFYYKSLSIRMDRDTYTEAGHLLKKQLKLYTDTVNTLKSKNIKKVLEIKPCKNKDQHDSYGFHKDCELSHICFHRKEILGHLLEHTQKFYKVDENKIKEILKPFRR